MNKILKIILIFLGILVLVVGCYVLYLFTSYHRIEDNQVLTIDEGAALKAITPGEAYTIATNNIGFGAYSSDYSFFMDGGTESRAFSKEAVMANTEGIITDINKLKPDFVFFQEVDLDATRSYHVNQYELLKKAFDQYDSVKSISYDSAYLFYPLTAPHGKSLSSIATFSKYKVESSLRRSLPIATNLSRFLDLDRCYSVTGVPVDNGKTLYLYNVHLSAYGGSPEIRNGQMNMLLEDMNNKIKQGDYVICGGDFNHDFTGDSTEALNKEPLALGWNQPFPIDMLPKDIIICKNYSDEEMIPTTRNTDIPYEKGVSFVVIVDGFLVSSNIIYTDLNNLDNNFKFTDHNPVQMKFILKNQ